MNRFSRVRHHITTEDVKKKHHEKIAVENFKRVETEIVKDLSQRFRRDWRKELVEGMTTANALSTVLPAEGDTAIDQVSPTDSASFADTTNMFGSGLDNPALDGTTIRANGSGSGSGGGFNVGGEYLAFQGNGSGGSRMALLKPMDATTVDTLTITAIRGNSVNGGEEADIVGQEELFLIYKTPDMSRSSYISQDRNNNNVGSFPADAAIIAIGQGDGTLQNYSITIPEYARQKDVVFGLFQLSHSGAGFDHYGVTDIKFQRKTPINVVVPLDSPEAISFVRVGTDEGDPKKRKKKVNDQLAASDEYTTKQLGTEFPGQGSRLGDEASSAGAPDPFSSASIQEPDASPIGKSEVTKSFANFSATAAAAEPEAEPETEPITPSSQTTMNPTGDDGEPIPVKPVGAKNSGVVQGADAANVDAQNAQEPEPEPIEPEPETPELDPEELKASEEEKQGKTPEEVEEIENEKFNAKADETADYIDKLINFDLNLGLSSFNALAQVTGVAINAVISVVSAVSLLRGATTVKEGDGFLGGLGKIKNSIDIARGVLSGKVVNTKILPQEMNTFIKSLKVDEFATKQTDNKSLNKIMISDVRHEYADDNIYVKDGKIYQNGSGKPGEGGIHATPLAGSGFAGVSNHGFGYAQMIIPKDGSDPYLHYYDHNYENLNNVGDVSATGGILQTSKAEIPQEGVGPLLKSISNIIHQLKGDNIKFVPQKLRESLVSYFGAFDQVMEGLKSTSSLEGFPPGIHGSALTDFKVPLSKLPQETQDMIAAHPLSWTPERIENMSDEQLYGQLYPLIETDEQFEYYMDFTSDITKMSVEPVNTVPFAVAMQEMDEVYEQYENDLLEKYGEDGWEEFTSGLNRETSEFFAAETAAQKDLETLEGEEQKELDENDRVRGFEAIGALYDRLVKPLYDSVSSTLDSGGTVSKATMDKLSRQYDKYKKQADKMEKEFFKIQSEILDEYRDLREPIENIAYEQLFYLREPVKDSPTGQARYKIKNRDGDESSGADYTALDGTVYKGKNTYFDEYYNGEENFMNQMNALYDPVADLQRYVDGAFVKEGIAERFESDFGFSSENWSPAKSGDGKPRGDSGKPKSDPDPRYAYAGTGADASFTIDPVVPLGAQDGDKLAGIGGVVGGITAVAAFLGMAADAARTWWKNASPEQRQKIKDLINNRQNAHYVPTGDTLLEKYARPQPKRGHLFEKIKSKGFFNQNDIKPIFPENPPPKLDPKTGMHPQYGKKAARFKKLDPISANSMPPTGDPDTDAVVNKQKTINKIKKMARNK